MEKKAPKTELFVFEYLEDAELEDNDVVGCGADVSDWRVLML